MADPEERQESVVALVRPLLMALDRLEAITRQMSPPRLPELAASLGPDDRELTQALDRVHAVPWPSHLVPFRDQIVLAAQCVIGAHSGLREAGLLAAAGDTSAAIAGAYRATRRQFRALEALYPLVSALPAVSQFFIEPRRRDDAGLLALIGVVGRPQANTGLFHFDNDAGTRGGFSVYVPEYLTLDKPAPVVFALHGGSGHGRVFMWNWLREARSRGVVLVAPTSAGETWSLTRPDLDGAHLSNILSHIRQQWLLDTRRVLLTGMSDGGTFALLSGLEAASPFTHLAPVAAAFHPLLVAMSDPARLRDLPVYLVHGTLDWMFPIEGARNAAHALTAAGADVVFREIADLSHTYPRDENNAILDWLTA
jgi:phospholipase/carboxylesterase